MKRICLIGRLLPARLLLSTLLLFAYSFLPAQFLPSNPARFGVDGDIAAEENRSGSFAATGSHDWFPGTTAAGYSVFDTGGAEDLKSALAAGSNHAFTRRMQHQPYTVQDGMLMLCGTYARDYFGLADIGSRAEKTLFLASAPNNKSYGSPGSWTTIPAGSVPAKSDIIDAYIHMRRNGTSIAAGSPDNLIIYLGASTLNTGGDHYLDFELYKSNIDYNSVTGLFSAAGPALTGGRNIWEFNADGSVKTFGEMTLSFSFDNSRVSDIAIYLWVPYSTFDAGDPKDFDFDREHQNGWWGAPKSGYGYARIKPNAGSSLQAWGAVNTTSTPAPAWGTSAQQGGSVTSNYYSASYSAGQLAEAAIDLSSLGIDPAFATSGGKCSSPYLKVLVKSKSSSSASATLQDFIAPFELFEEPVLPTVIAAPGLITCAQATQTLTPQQVVEGAVYKWTTTDGEIISGGHTARALVGKRGEYTLSAALYEGCTETIARVVVSEDTYRPVASAGFTGMLSNDPESFITLKGGDAEKSNYETPFGPSAGLQWAWTGPDGYTASEQNPRAHREGEYHLTVTEQRNGCTATASVTIDKAAFITLPLTLLDFSGRQDKEALHLRWVVAENEEAQWFEVQRAAGSTGFTSIAFVLASSQIGRETYTFRERTVLPKATYRLKAVDKEGKVQYSQLVQLRADTPEEPGRLSILQNPVISDPVAVYHAPHPGPVRMRLYSAAGQLVYTGQVHCGAGENRLFIPGRFLAAKGQYVLEVADSSPVVSRTRVLKL